MSEKKFQILTFPIIIPHDDLDLLTYDDPKLYFDGGEQEK